MAALTSSVHAVDAGHIYFENKIRPLLADHCLKCHDGANGKSKGGLTLDTRAGWEKGGDTSPAIVPGKPDDSLLYKALLYTHPDVKMPPKKEGGKLTDEQIASVREWIAMGAPDPREGGSKKLTGLTPEARAHWIYQPVHEPPLPAIKDPWIRNEVDAFVLAKLRANGMNPNPPAAKEVLLRRVSYDVIGPMHIQLLANLSRAVIWLSKRGFARRSAFQHTVCSAVIFRLAPSATEARSAAGSVLR